MSKRVVLGMAAWAMALALTGPPGAAAEVRVGLYENPPLLFTDTDGEAAGIFPDLLAHMAVQEGWRLTWVGGSWRECLERLERGEIDLLPAIAYSEARAERFDFSTERVLTNWGQVYARAGSGIESVLDLRDKTVAVLEGDIYHERFGELVRRFGVRCRFLEASSYAAVLEAVAEGRAEAGVTDRLYGALHGGERSLRCTPIVFAPVDALFAVPQGRQTALLDALDAHLGELKRVDDSPYHESLDRWLGTGPAGGWPRWATWVLVGAAALVGALGVGSVALSVLVRRRTAELGARNLALQAEVAERERAEQALRKAEQERAIILDTVSEIVTYLDRDLRVIWANRAAAELCGIPAHQMAGQHCYAIWQEADEPCETCTPRRAMETGEVQQGEVTTPDDRAFHVRAYPVRDEAGAVVGSVEVGLDVTERERAKQRRRESEAEKEMILGSIAELVSFQDTELRILWANRAAAETVGLKPEDLVGRYCYDVWCHRASGSPQCPVRRALEAGEPRQGEMTTPDGRVWDIRGYPVRDDDGQILGAVEVTLEITERRRAEEEARRQSAFRTTLIEASPTFFVAIGPDGKTLMMNESMLIALRYSLDEVVGKDYLTTFVPERERERVARVFHRLTDIQGPALNENHVVAKDGRELLVEWHGRPVVDEDGAFDYFFGVGIDITERRRAEQELREREARYRAIVEAFDGFIYICSPDYRIEFMNQRLIERTGRDATGELCYEALHDRDSICPWCVNERVFHGETVRWEIQSPKDNRWYYVVNTPIYHADGTMSKQSMILDTTERKKAEEELRRHRERLEELVAERTAELEEVNRELEAFAYSVSHDLRAPLRAIEGFGDALGVDYSDRLDGEGRGVAASIARSARKMQALIDDLLAYSRVGRTEMRLGPVSLQHVVEESLIQLAAAVSDSGAEVQLDEPLPAVVAHKATLIQAVTNLLSNAVKFVAPGEAPRVRVRAERRDGAVRLWVEDQGIGIPPDALDRIFTVFERLHGDQAYRGTGVGLAIVRRGIERMGGRVGVHSEPGAGSRFWVELPAADAEPGA